MPKVVDHEERRSQVATAVLRVIANNGVGGVTLNDVSSESGWSRGVLTHYFGNKASLLEAALHEGMRDIAACIRQAAAEPDARRAIQLVIEEALPLDPRRLAFARVYVSFMAESIVSEHLSAYFAYNHEAWRTLVASIIVRGREQGELAGTLDSDSAAEALSAVADGLRAQSLVDTGISPDRQRENLATWIDVILPRPAE